MHQSPSTQLSELINELDEYKLKYNMNHPKRGFALVIINSYFYNSDLNFRGGVNDALQIRIALEKLEFQVDLHENVTLDKMKMLMNKYANRVDHSNNDCFACVISSHGRENEIRGVDHSSENDKKYIKIVDLLFPFENCMSLAGKPKLFFIDCCRGPKRLSTFEHINRTNKRLLSSKSNTDEIKLSRVVDFFVQYANVFGHMTYFNKGSWYLQTLASEMKKVQIDEEFMTVILRIQNELARKLVIKSKAPANAEPCEVVVRCMTPSSVLQTRKHIYFEPKRGNTSK